MKLRQNQISLITKIFIDLFSNLEKVFQCFENTRIRRIAVLLGATIATPKEVHFIDLPRRLLMKQENGAVSNPFASDRSLTQMFRTLFIKSSCKTWPCISPTNITVLLLMRRDCKSEWFLPKTCYVLPHCNNEVIYRLTHSLNTSLGTPINDLKSRGRYTCMCPFDVYESPMTGPQNCKAGQLPPNNCASVPTSGVYKQKMDVGSDTEEDDDLIWFQMPVSAKGILNL